MMPVFAAAAALLAPGLLLDLLLVPQKSGALARLARGHLLSLAAWPVVLFLLRWTPASLGGIAWTGVALGVVGSFALLLRRRAKTSATELCLCATVVAFAAAHLLPLARWPVAPGSDMAMHSFMARLVVEAGRMPSSYEPYYPVHEFGSFSAGFPMIAAVLSALSGAPAHRTALALALLVYPALAAALFLVARRFAREVEALAAAVLVATASGPYAFLHWGGNPTILALALGFAAIAPLVGAPPGERREDDERTMPVLAAGATLVHVICPLGLAYATPMAVLGWTWLREPRGRRLARIGRLAALAAIAAGIVAIAYATGTHAEVSQREIDFTRSWQRDMPHAFRGRAADFAVTIWPYLDRMLGRTWTVAAGVGLAVAALSRDRRQLPWAAYALVAALLVLNSRYWVLPGSPALYPERMAELLLAPAAAALAASVAWGRSALAAARPKLLWPAAVVLVAMGAQGVRGAYAGLRHAGGGVMVTAGDLAALSWLELHVPPGQPVGNRFGDAGVWIPALAGRAVTRPHLNLFDTDEVERWARTVCPRWTFRGARSPFGVDAEMPSSEALRADAGQREVFSSAGAAVFERVQLGAP